MLLSPPLASVRMRGLGRGRWSPFRRWGRNDRKIGWLVTMTYINVVSCNIGTVQYVWLSAAFIFLYIILPCVWMGFRSHCFSNIVSILKRPVDKKSPLFLSPCGFYFYFLLALFSLLDVLQHHTEHSVSGWSHWSFSFKFWFWPTFRYHYIVLLAWPTNCNYCLFVLAYSEFQFLFQKVLFLIVSLVFMPIAFFFWGGGGTGNVHFRIGLKYTS